jgi:DNA helicase-2/ATP-dependent DNA helicase PcrA
MPLKDLNPAQLQAVQHTSGPLLIVAGAGTGKTTVITEKIAYLITEKNIKSEEILALTFTDKAAIEMEERVDRLLPYGYTDLWVMTFHAFCQRLLEQHGLDIGLPNNFKLLNQTEQWLLVRQNLDKFNLDYYRPLGNPTKFIHALIKHFSRCKDEEIGPAEYLKYAENLKINLDSMEASGGVTLKHKSIKTLKQDPLPPTAVGGLPLIKGESLKAPLLDKEGVGGGNEEEINTSEIIRLIEVANAYHVYQQLLLDNGALDFGDLINYTLKLFRTRPQILKKYQTQFKYILVDEFQDTNWAQYELVKLLCGQQPNLTVVGDDDQSIYKFRGASVSNILQFKEDFPQSAEIFLNQNYRSSQNILDLAYNFIQLNNPERLEIKLRNQKTENGNQKLTKKLIADTSAAGTVEHLHFSTETEETAGVVNKIIELYNAAKEDVSWNDFAVLIRANHQAEGFLNALQAAAIPFNFVASKGLYAKEIILDIFAYLKLLDNYHESLAFWRLLNLPSIKIKLEDLMELSRFANRKALSLFEAAQQIDVLNNLTAETKRKIKKILSLLAAHTLLAKEKSVQVMVLKFLEDFSYQQFLLAPENEQSILFVRQLLEKIDDFQNSFADKSVRNFMALIELELEAGEAGSLSAEAAEGPEAVKVMTVHAAKGLEFKYVFIVNLVDKRFPSLERREPIELPDALVKEKIPSGDIHLQEERRLFYVAMTRAKRGLFFTSAENYGGKEKKKASRFLFEVGLQENVIPNSHPEYSGRVRNLVSHNIIQTEARSLVDPITIGSSRDDKNLKAHFSFSALKAYETCPYQYYLAYLLRLPVIGKATFSFGKTMHVTLQKFFSLIKEHGEIEQGNLFGNKKAETTLPPLEKLMEIYQASWLDDWYENKKQKEEYRARGEKSLRALYAQLQTNGLPKILDLEKGFHFKLADYTIKGVIDRVDQTAAGIEIIDYKTGGAKTGKNVDKDQLLIYQLAAAETFGWPVAKMSFYYLDDNSVVSFLGSADDLQKQKEKMLNLIAGIRSENFIATPSSFNCQYCDFRSICKYKEI